MEWYATELRVLESSPLVTLHIYATRNTSSASNTPISATSIYTLAEIEKSSPPTINSTQPETPISPRYSTNYDIEKYPEAELQSSRPSTIVRLGRPDIAHLITEVVEKAETSDRIAVASCGPYSLMQVTRKTVAEYIKVEGPSLELYCEQFGY
jgi:hypothetical protein